MMIERNLLDFSWRMDSSKTNLTKNNNSDASVFHSFFILIQTKGKFESVFFFCHSSVFHSYFIALLYIEQLFATKSAKSHCQYFWLDYLF